ncbi:myoneurin-like [Branchiostoma lanceolatum]|uniref:myoneurin-like n=1 Tax=Branchiostoma lanceolatum TaxID=7740 RepID=UPI0034535942
MAEATFQPPGEEPHTTHSGNEAGSSLEQTTDPGQQQDVLIEETCDGDFAQSDEGGSTYLHVSGSAGHRSRQREKSATAHICTYCGYSTRVKANLKRQARKHTDEKPYTCDQCDYSAIQKCQIDRHVLTRHTAEKPYKCDQCDYCSALKGRLDRHVMKKHAGEKPYKCDQCDYSTARKCRLDEHVMIKHTGKKPYMCELN